MQPASIWIGAVKKRHDDQSGSFSGRAAFLTAIAAFRQGLGKRPRQVSDQLLEQVDGQIVAMVKRSD